MFDPASAQTAFENSLAKNELELASLSPEAGVDAMLAFYRDERAKGCEIENDGDMVLFQWGTYDWGDGEFFELDITRQLIPSHSSDDESILQLSLTFRFTPTNDLKDLGSANRWCESPFDLEDCVAFIEGSPAMQFVGARTDGTVEVAFGVAG